MIHHARIAGTLLLAAALTPAIFGGTAHAADSIRYVSITGSNANPCTLAKPCRSLQRAIGVTPEGGEIRVLDSGFFGNNATIRKSLTVSGNGHTVFLRSPIVVHKADAIVALRGLLLSGGAGSQHGIVVSNASTVHIERCTIQRFASDGIRVDSGVDLFVTDSISRENGGDGLLVFGGAPTRVTIDNSRFESNGENGMDINGAESTITRVVASGNGDVGIEQSGGRINATWTTATSNVGNGFSLESSGQMALSESVASGNGGDGLRVFVGSIARISKSTFIGNATGVRNNGTVETRQNNTVRGNTTNVTGALTPFAGL